MYTCPKPLLTLIFNKFHPYYRPLLRLVCKQWSDVVRERRCDGLKIAEELPIITIPFLETLKQEFPMKNTKYFSLVCKKSFFDGKIETLKYLISIGIYRLIPRWQIRDVKTLEFLDFIKPIKFTTIKLSHYSKDVVLFYEQRGVIVNWAKITSIPTDEIPHLTLTNTNKAILYAYNDSLQDLMSCVLDDVKIVLASAIKGRAINCIQYILNTYPQTGISLDYYEIHPNDRDFLNFLLDQRQLFIANKLIGGLSLEFIQRYCQKFSAWNLHSLAIASNRIDICEFLEWHGHVAPKNILSKVVDGAKPYAEIRLALSTLVYCCHRQLDIQTYIDFITINDEILEFCIEHKLKIGWQAFVGIMEYGSLESLGFLIQQNIEIQDQDVLDTLYMHLKLRGSPKFNQQLVPYLLRFIRTLT